MAQLIISCACLFIDFPRVSGLVRSGTLDSWSARSLQLYYTFVCSVLAMISFCIMLVSVTK